MTHRDTKPENCPLCRRPKWPGDIPLDRHCDAESPGLTRTARRIALDDCRRVALTVAALVAPVVEAGIAWDQTNNLGDQRALHEAVEQMCAGLRGLGGGS